MHNADLPIRRQDPAKKAQVLPRVSLHGTLPKFSMAFQPVVNIATGSTYAYEALVRSTDGESAYSVLSRVPAKNYHMFDKACRSRAVTDAIRWGLLNNPDYKLCLNVNPNSAVQAGSNLHLTCEEAHDLGFPLDRLVLELIENDEISNFVSLKRMVDEYRECGVLVAMDDFGSGYSGLKLLAKLKPNIIKLDIALTSRVDHDRTSAVMVKAIVQACHDLNILPIGEGVERYDTAMTLRDMGVVYQQGFYFARPGFEHLPHVNYGFPGAGANLPV